MSEGYEVPTELPGSTGLSAAASIYLYRHTPSSQLQVYQVKQLRADGIDSRESAGIGPVVLKLVSVAGDAFSGFSLWSNYYAPLFSAGRPGSSEVPRNPLTRWDVSSIPANGIFLIKKLKNKNKMPNGWRTIKSLVHKIRLHGRRGERDG